MRTPSGSVRYGTIARLLHWLTVVVLTPPGLTVLALAAHVGLVPSKQLLPRML